MLHLSHRISPLFMRRLARLLVVPLVALALSLRMPLAAHAAGTIVVNSLSDIQTADGSCTLREAISAANYNLPVDTCAAGTWGGTDIISFSISGTIVLGNNLPRTYEYQKLTIRGPGADRLTISGSNALQILSVSGWLNLENVTIANASGSDNPYIPNGGGILNYGTLNVTNSIFSGNRADEGGAIFNHNGTLNVTGSTFTSNRADEGGAIFNHNGTLNITGSTFTGDSWIMMGGAIFNGSGTLNVTGSTFISNRAATGGAIFNEGGMVNVTGSTFTGNSALTEGGGIKSIGVLTVGNSTFSGNSAHRGGGIYGAELSVTNSTFSGNSANYGGGGIYGDGLSVTNYGAELSVTNSTFSGNSAGYSGGGISGNELSVTNSTFFGNSANYGGGVAFGRGNIKNTILANNAGRSCGGSWASGTHNLVTDASCGPGATQTSSAALLLGPLQDNGGPTKTIAPQAGSIAIDGGDPAICAAEPVSNRDQRGKVRPQGIGCDVGAVEVKPSGYSPVAKDDSYTTVANPAQPLSVEAAHGLLANDYDQDGDALTTLLVSEPSHGKLALNADDSFTYIPSRGFQGSDSFTYRASDGSRESNAATVTITVGIVAATADSYSTTQDTALTVDAPGVLANDAHADGKPLLAILVSGPSHGKLSLNEDGSFTYLPEEGFGKGDSFVYVASDGGRESDAATVTIAVTP
jgi:CSLREA domain-containing protein